MHSSISIYVSQRLLSVLSVVEGKFMEQFVPELRRRMDFKCPHSMKSLKVVDQLLLELGRWVKLQLPSIFMSA